MRHTSPERKKHSRLRSSRTYTIHASSRLRSGGSSPTSPLDYPESLMLYNATPPPAPFSPTKNWDPDTALGLIHPMRGMFTCTGYAPSSGRRCIEAVHSFGDGRAILGKLAKMEIPDAVEATGLLKEAAALTLCRQHGWQAHDISRQWGSLLRARAAKIRAAGPPPPLPPRPTTVQAQVHAALFEQQPPPPHSAIFEQQPQSPHAAMASVETVWSTEFEVKGAGVAAVAAAAAVEVTTDDESGAEAGSDDDGTILDYETSKQLLQDLLWVIGNLRKVMPNRLPRDDMTLQELQNFLEAQLADQERSKLLMDEKLAQQGRSKLLMEERMAQQDRMRREQEERAWAVRAEQRRRLVEEQQKRETELREAAEKEATMKETAEKEAAAKEVAMKKEAAEKEEAEMKEETEKQAAEKEAVEKEAAKRDAEMRETAKREAAMREAILRDAAKKEAEIRDAEMRETAKREAAMREAIFARREAALREAAARVAIPKTPLEPESWDAAWSRYEDAWERVRINQNEQAEPQGLPEQRIPWPVKSGRLVDVNSTNIRQFFRNAPAQHIGDTADDLFRFLNAENKRWHTDKLLQQFGPDVVNGELKEALSTVAQVLIQLRQRAQTHRRN